MIAGSTAILLTFLVLRLVLLLLREPFFDELFTIWIARKSIPEMWRALLQDSGPPLYYALVRAVFGAFLGSARAFSEVLPVRVLSLAAGFAAFLLVLRARSLGDTRYVAALLIALFPAHFYFSAEARPYALCSAFVALAVLAIGQWKESGSPRHLTLAVIGLLLAAYSHYYAVLLFPLPLLTALLTRRRATIGHALAATLALAVVFVPGFALAAHQPPQAIHWMRSQDPGALGVLASAAQQFGFAAPYPHRFLVSPPTPIQWLSIVLVALTVSWGLRYSREMRVYALAIALPVVLAAAFAAAGRNVYFPMRFESVFAAPFAVMLAAAMSRMPRKIRAALLAMFILIGWYACYRGLVERRIVSDDPYRLTARFSRNEIRGVTIVASGPQYLEVWSQLDRAWHPSVVAFPQKQGEHPGWRSEEPLDALMRERDALLRRIGSDFVWMGEAGSMEYYSLSRALGSTVVYRRPPVAVMIMSPDRMQEQKKEHSGEPGHEGERDRRAAR